MFPKDVALPVGGPGTQQVVLELHYNNPHLISGIIDAVYVVTLTVLHAACFALFELGLVVNLNLMVLHCLV